MRANVTMGVPTFVRLIAGIAKNKTAALLLGTSGVGIIGLGSQLQMLGVTAGSVSTPTGLIRLLGAALANGDEKSKRDVLGTAFTFQLILNSILFLAGLMLARPLVRWTFGDSGSISYLIPILVTIPIQSMLASYLIGVFYSYGHLPMLARSMVIASISEAVSYIVLVRYVGIVGAFWGITIGMTCWLLAIAYYATRFETAANLFHFKLKREYLKELVGTGLIMNLAGLVTYSTTMLIRVRILSSLGASSAGIYQVVLALTAYYIPYFTNGVWSRLMPKITRGGLDRDGMRGMDRGHSSFGRALGRRATGDHGRSPPSHRDLLHRKLPSRA